jgi:hypothetical protein
MAVTGGKIHVLDPNVDDFLSNLDTYIFELLNVNSRFLQDLSCIILYGNEDIYLEAYARAMIQQFYSLDTLHLMESDDLISSSYHFEMDYDAKQVANIKSIIQNKNISGRKHIFILKKFYTSSKQVQLKNLIDQDNVVFIILAKTISGLHESIISRATMLRIPFNKEKITNFVKTHYNIETPKEDASLIDIIANRTAKPKYEEELYKLLDVINKSRNQLDISNAIKDYCYKIFHLCIPLAHLAKLIIRKCPKHPELIEACAQCDHDMSVGTRDILNYEQLFVKVWQILRT